MRWSRNKRGRRNHASKGPERASAMNQPWHWGSGGASPEEMRWGRQRERQEQVRAAWGSGTLRGGVMYRILTLPPPTLPPTFSDVYRHFHLWNTVTSRHISVTSRHVSVTFRHILAPSDKSCDFTNYEWTKSILPSSPFTVWSRRHHLILSPTTNKRRRFWSDTSYVIRAPLQIHPDSSFLWLTQILLPAYVLRKPTLISNMKQFLISVTPVPPAI